MEGKMPSPVYWLFEKFKETIELRETNAISEYVQREYLDNFVKQALALEKRLIIDNYNGGYGDALNEAKKAKKKKRKRKNK
jgi:hypothetical protein